MPAFPLYGTAGRWLKEGGRQVRVPFALPEQQEADGAVAR
jgi:hypothetical protein